jgi:hypothetical protein
MNRTILASLVVVLAASAAAADEIVLTNGKKITNAMVSSKTPDRVVIEVGGGTITLPAKDVSAINPARTPLHDYHDKIKTVGNSTKASDYWDLALWAKMNGLTRYTGALSEKVISLDPNHEGARRELRHEKVGGKWLSYEQAQEAKGLRMVDGRWMTAAEVELREKKRLEAQERAEIAKKERQERIEEEKKRRQEAAEAHAAMINQQLAGLDGYFYQASEFWPPYFRPYPWAAYLRSRRYYQEGWMYNQGGYGTFDLFRFIPNPVGKFK